MGASLPTELKLVIIEEVFAELPAQQRQGPKHNLRSISREWYHSVDYWGDLHVRSLDQVEALKRRNKSKVRRANTLDQVKSIRLVMLSRKGKDKGAKVAGLFRVLPNLESVAISTGTCILSSGDRQDSLGDLVRAALAALCKIKHFALDGPTNVYGDVPHVFDNTLKLLVSHWPDLSSIDLGRATCMSDSLYYERRPSQSTSVLTNATRLSAVSLTIPYSNGVCDNVLLDLPASVTTVAIRGSTIYYNTALGQSIASHLAPSAGQLTSLVIVDPARAGQEIDAAPRGACNALFGGLRALTELEIGPCAVSNLATSLGQLAGLRELRVVEGATRAWPAIDHTEVHALLTASPSLRNVALPRSWWKAWTAADRAAIEGAAELKSIQLVQI